MTDENHRTTLYLALNAISSICIVYMNKLIFKEYGFTYGTLLTVIHFFFTSLGLVVCHFMGVFEPKPIPFLKVLPLCLSFCGFVALTNISLVYNSIGFYQLIKVLTTPMLVVIQTLFYQKTFSGRVKLSLTLTCGGVALATCSDTSANFWGTAVALTALLVTCMYQIWVGTKQTELQCNSFQLLYIQAPISCVMLIPVMFVADDLSNKFYWPCWDTIMMICLSGLLAFLVNISIFLVIGKTSPVTYNVLGHFKLCVILSMGFLFFGDEMNFRIFAGIMMTLGGIFWYTHLKISEAPSKEAAEAYARIVVQDEEDLIAETSEKRL